MVCGIAFKGKERANYDLQPTVTGSLDIGQECQQFTKHGLALRDLFNNSSVITSCTRGLWQ